MRILMLLVDLNPSPDKYSIGYFVGLAVFLFLVGIFAFRALMRNKKKALKAGAKKQSAEAIVPPKPGDYESVPGQTWCYRSILNSKMLVKIIPVGSTPAIYTSYGPGDSENKFIFATSLAHKTLVADKELLLNSLPEIAGVNIEKSHEIIISVSRVVSFLDLRDFILRFIFRQLDSRYDWMYKKQSIRISPKSIFYQGDVNLILKSEIYFYWRLEGRLEKIKNVTDVFKEKAAVTMGDANCNVRIYYDHDESYNYDELVLEIKKVITDHVKSGVEFIEGS